MIASFGHLGPQAVVASAGTLCSPLAAILPGLSDRQMKKKKSIMGSRLISYVACQWPERK
jgi:trimethylamine:corrinoid methyltransferase-like protein